MEEHTRHFIYKISTLAVIGAVVIVALVRERIIDNPHREVAVQGEGRVFIKPDIAQVTLAVSIFKKPSPADAIKEGADKINAVTGKLKTLGVEEKDIQTTTFNLNPEYSYDKGVSSIVGYSLNQQLRVKVRKIDTLGQVLQSAVDVGANQIGDVQFVIDDIESARQLARDKAIDQAKQKAKAVANASGIRLGKVVGFFEDSTPPSPITYGYGMGGNAATADKVSLAPSTPPGENEIVVDVTLNYEIK